MSVTLPSAEQALPPVHHYHDGVLVALDILEGRRYRLMPPSGPTNVSRRTGRASENLTHPRNRGCPHPCRDHSMRGERRGFLLDRGLLRHGRCGGHGLVPLDRLRLARHRAGEHQPESDLDLRIFVEELGTDAQTIEWWMQQNQTDFADLKSQLLPVPLAIHRDSPEKGDDCIEAVRAQRTSPKLKIGKVVCVWTPPKP